MGSRLLQWMVTAGALAGVVLAGNDVGAQDKKDPPKKEAPAPKDPPKPKAIDVKPLLPKLESSDEGQIRSAVDELRIAGTAGAAAAPALAKALGKGFSTGLTQAAIETLGDLEAEAGTPVLVQYASHRDVKVRRAAVKALTRTKGAPAAVALRHALSDQDANVRGTAASGLGTLKAKDAVPDLFTALAHRVNEAAVSLGVLCNPEQCEQLANTLGKYPFDVVGGGLDQVLSRPTAEVSDDAKIKIIGRVRELGTMEANKFLKEVQKRYEKSSARVKQSVDQAVIATSAGSK